MVGKEVVDHICDRGSALNRLPESITASAELWISSATLFSLAQRCAEFYRKAFNFCECCPCPADEVIVSLSLTEKQGQEADSSSLLTSLETVIHRNYSKLFPGSVSVMYIALFHILR